MMLTNGNEDDYVDYRPVLISNLDTLGYMHSISTEEDSCHLAEKSNKIKIFGFVIFSEYVTVAKIYKSSNIVDGKENVNLGIVVLDLKEKENMEKLALNLRKNFEGRLEAKLI